MPIVKCLCDLRLELSKMTPGDGSDNSSLQLSIRRIGSSRFAISGQAGTGMSSECLLQVFHR